MTEPSMTPQWLAAAAAHWVRVADQEIFVSDLIDRAAAPAARMTVGFARVAAGETLPISFPYDEVLVLTAGRYTVRTEDGRTLTAQAGEVLYLPAGSSNVATAEQDCEMVYVAAPPDVYAAHVAAAG